MNHSELDTVWFPLSQAQRSRWFMYQFDSADQGKHNNGFSVRLRGGVDVAALTAGLQQLLAQHPMLRARFRQVDGEPQQTIDASASVNISHCSVPDLAALPEQVRRDCQTAFDTASAPLIRAHLYPSGTDEAVLLLVFDHLISDGWSFWQLMEELGRKLNGLAPAQPSAAASYQDYIGWQQQWLASEAAEQQAHYWQQQLAGELPVLQIPSECAPNSPAELGVYTLTLNQNLADTLRQFSRQQNGSMFTTLLSAYSILLHRYSGQDDIIVGAPMPGRTGGKWDSVVGDFVNPISLRTHFAQDMTVKQVLRSVRSNSLRSMRHQDLPFNLLIEKLGIRATAEPVFQTMFIFQKARHAQELLSLWDT